MSQKFLIKDASLARKLCNIAAAGVCSCSTAVQTAFAFDQLAKVQMIATIPVLAVLFG